MQTLCFAKLGNFMDYYWLFIFTSSTTKRYLSIYRTTPHFLQSISVTPLPKIEKYPKTRVNIGISQGFGHFVPFDYSALFHTENCWHSLQCFCYLFKDNINLTANSNTLQLYKILHHCTNSTQSTCALNKNEQNSSIPIKVHELYIA